MSSKLKKVTFILKPLLELLSEHDRIVPEPQLEAAIFNTNNTHLKINLIYTHSLILNIKKNKTLYEVNKSPHFEIDYPFLVLLAVLKDL